MMMDVPMVDKRKSNHAAIWIVALLIAGATVGVAYFIFAEFEHSSWFSRDLRRFLNRYTAILNLRNYHLESFKAGDSPAKT